MVRRSPLPLRRWFERVKGSHGWSKPAGPLTLEQLVKTDPTVHPSRRWVAYFTPNLCDWVNFIALHTSTLEYPERQRPCA